MAIIHHTTEAGNSEPLLKHPLLGARLETRTWDATASLFDKELYFQVEVSCHPVSKFAVQVVEGPARPPSVDILGRDEGIVTHTDGTGPKRDGLLPVS